MTLPCRILNDKSCLCLPISSFSSSLSPSYSSLPFSSPPPFFPPNHRLSLSVWASMTKNVRLGSLNNDLFLIVLEPGVFKVKEPADLVSC